MVTLEYWSPVSQRCWVKVEEGFLEQAQLSESGSRGEVVPFPEFRGLAPIIGESAGRPLAMGLRAAMGENGGRRGVGA